MLHLKFGFETIKNSFKTCQNVGDKYCYLGPSKKNEFRWTKMHKNAYGKWNSCVNLCSNSHSFYLLKWIENWILNPYNDANNSKQLDMQMICKKNKELELKQCMKMHVYSWINGVLWMKCMNIWQYASKNMINLYHIYTWCNVWIKCN